jgi:hypothetical protein
MMLSEEVSRRQLDLDCCFRWHHQESNVRFRNMWLLVLAALLSLHPGVLHAAIQVFQHQDRPAIDPWIAPKGSPIDSLEITLVGRTSEGRLLETVAGATRVTVDYNPAPAQDLAVAVYRVAAVGRLGKDRFLDPLIPLKPGTTVDCDKSSGFFYVKVSAGRNGSPIRGESKITFKAGMEEQSLKLSYAVLPFSIQDGVFPTIQATVRPMFGAYPRLLSRDERLQVLKNIATLLAASYHVRSFAGFGGTGKPDLTVDWSQDQGVFSEMARYCLEELATERLRIPAHRLFSKHHPLASVYPKATEQAVYEDLVRYRKQVEGLIANPGWKGRLSMRLWDEPRPFEYSDVVMTYKAARRAFPELSLELTEQPDDQLGDIADVWVIHPRFFNEGQTKKQQSKGAKAWIYCNRAAQSEESLKEMRIIGWMLWRYGLDGYLFYSINYWNFDPWVQSDRDWAGTFVYPDLSGTDVYSSLKLEAFRDGIEDAAILKQLETLSQQGDGAKTKELLARLRGVYSMAEVHFAAPDPRSQRKVLMEHIAVLFKP